jgi:hypothetical protein
MGILREQQILVGLTHPLGDILLFDYKTNHLIKAITGIPWRLGNPISRELIVAPSGRIYIYRGTEELNQRDEKHAVWLYDPHQDELTKTRFEITQGFWIGQTQTRDGRKIYVSTTNGELYEFDTLTENSKICKRRSSTLWGSGLIYGRSCEARERFQAACCCCSRTQIHGRSSSRRLLGQRLTKRTRTSASQTWGSIPFSLAVSMSEARMAQFSAPSS